MSAAPLGHCFGSFPPWILNSTKVINRWLYRRQVVADGNFSADHMKMRTPDKDVALTDGQGYVCRDAPYQSHLKSSIETKAVSLSLIFGHSFPAPNPYDGLSHLPATTTVQ